MARGSAPTLDGDTDVTPEAYSFDGRLFTILKAFDVVLSTCYYRRSSTFG
jgi:hypothetical protein